MTTPAPIATTPADAQPPAPPSRVELPQLEGEPSASYHALTTLAAKPPAQRNNSELARQVGTSRNTVQKYSKRWRWPERLDAYDRARAAATLDRVVTQADAISEDVARLARQAQDVAAYEERTKGVANLALNLASRLGTLLHKRLQNFTDDDVAKLKPRDLALLLPLVSKLAETSMAALGEQLGAHEYTRFLTEQAEELAAREAEQLRADLEG